MWPLNRLFEARYGRYVDAVLEDWGVLWGFAAQRKVRKLRFRASVDTQWALDREVNRLCVSRPGDNEMLLLYGNAASTNIFGQTKGNVKGPAKTLFDAAVRHKKAVCVWADEFCTSKLDMYGHPVHHPRETRAEHTRPRACKSKSHAMDAPGCCCFCVHRSGCTAKRMVSRWCAEHAKPQFQYDVCYHNHGHKHEYRAWNWDVVGALNLDCLFLAQSLGLDLGLRKHGSVASDAPVPRKGAVTTPLSWAEIFGRAGHALPFSLPLALLPNSS